MFRRGVSKPATRAAHYVATLLGVGAGLSGLVLADPWLLALSIVGGYGIAIGSHYVFEKNAPLVRPHPIMAIRGDLWMFFLAVTGRLPAELARLGVSNPRP